MLLQFCICMIKLVLRALLRQVYEQIQIINYNSCALSGIILYVLCGSTFCSSMKFAGTKVATFETISRPNLTTWLDHQNAET